MNDLLVKKFNVKAQRGKRRCGRYGWKYRADKFVAVPAEQETISMVFSLRDAGHSLPAIAETLRNKGVVGRRGGAPDRFFVAALLRDHLNVAARTAKTPVERSPASEIVSLRAEIQASRKQIEELTAALSRPLWRRLLGV